MVKVAKDQPFPADMLLLSSSATGGVRCFVETKSLDGETRCNFAASLTADSVGDGEAPAARLCRFRSRGDEGSAAVFIVLASWAGVGKLGEFEVQHQFIVGKRLTQSLGAGIRHSLLNKRAAS